MLRLKRLLGLEPPESPPAAPAPAAQAPAAQAPAAPAPAAQVPAAQAPEPERANKRPKHSGRCAGCARLVTAQTCPGKCTGPDGGLYCKPECIESEHLVAMVLKYVQENRNLRVRLSQAERQLEQTRQELVQAQEQLRQDPLDSLAREYPVDRQ